MQAPSGSYSIGDMSRETGLSVSTLRYYEKLGLLAPVPRSAGNIRQYGEADLERLRMLECLKNTGMALKDIRTFFSWCDEGDATLPARYQMFLERRAETLRQISLLQKELRHIEYKCEFYNTALPRRRRCSALPGSSPTGRPRRRIHSRRPIARPLRRKRLPAPGGKSRPSCVPPRRML